MKTSLKEVARPRDGGNPRETKKIQMWGGGKKTRKRSWVSVGGKGGLPGGKDASLPTKKAGWSESGAKKKKRGIINSIVLRPENPV